jgi:Fur family peroxide stress response transcriptional regulator
MEARMAVDRAHIEERLSRLKEGLQRAGVKLTHQRLEICREMAESDGHPDAETVYERVRTRVPTISRDTVYRTLWLLLDLELIDRVATSRHRMRFDGNISPHHHFVCVRCGEARDFHSEEFDHLRVPNAASAYGSVHKIQVEARGTCLRCARASASRKPSAKGKESRNE